MTRTLTVDHLARIEGHAGITVTIENDHVDRVQFDIFEGIRLFEGLVRGRPVVEVAGIVSRICAICSHGHAITALEALERAMRIEISPQTRQLRELAYHGAAIESHALHVFCLALPDFLKRASVIEVAEIAPDAVAMALRLKKLGNTIQEVVGGRAVHPVNYAIGGFGRLPTSDGLLHLRRELVAGLEDASRAVEVVKGVDVPALSSGPIRCAALVPEADSYFFGREIRLADEPTADSWLPPSAFARSASADRRSLGGGWPGGSQTVVSVDDYRTFTNERAVPHSTAKHSAVADRPYMVGALPRLMLNGGRMTGRARAAWGALGPAVPCRNVVMNDIAQVIELMYSVEQALAIVDGFLSQGITPEPRRKFEPKAGRGTAASEVPRGILFHSYEVGSDGHIAAADVITPTAQNCAHVEQQFRLAVDARPQAADEELRQTLQVIARAYDPCVSCSVHVIRKG